MFAPSCPTRSSPNINFFYSQFSFVFWLFLWQISRSQLDLTWPDSFKNLPAEALPEPNLVICVTLINYYITKPHWNSSWMVNRINLNLVNLCPHSKIYAFGIWKNVSSHFSSFHFFYNDLSTHTKIINFKLFNVVLRQKCKKRNLTSLCPLIYSYCTFPIPKTRRNYCEMTNSKV